MKRLSSILRDFKIGKSSLQNVISYLDEYIKGEKEFLDGSISLDIARNKRCGFPEFIFGANKTPEQIVKIIERLEDAMSNILVTKLDQKVFFEIKSKIPKTVKYNELGKILYRIRDRRKNKGKVAILSAGTSDIPVALEAKYTIEVCGYKADTFFDIGVAGIHRLLNRMKRIREADVVIVVAGMEGALPSVVGGLVSVPVIAVPTSIGYGIAVGGVTAMFAMLSSCSNGITVVNIDNGFGAGCAAIRHLNSLERESVS